MDQRATKAKINTIIRAIRTEEAALRQRYAWLAHQNMIGMGILVLSLSAMIGLGALYYHTLIPAWLCVVLVAMVASISHELEHDLIHNLYFSKQKWVQNTMMLVVWLMRPNTINPWYRRKIHLHHHIVSGTEQDLEERLVGNGIKNPILRFIVIVDGLLGLLINRKRFSQEIKDFNFLRVFNAGFPITTAYFVVLYATVIYHLANLVFPLAASLPMWHLDVVAVCNFLMVTLILPNVLRSSSLNFVTSCMHYYGGVNNLYQQTHVITSKVFAPFHLFCFNFGKTHTIHHFVPNQPFYLRQAVSEKVNQIMRQQGMRFNDFKSILNANRYPAEAAN
jgi:fatty acid desaturase